MILFDAIVAWVIFKLFGVDGAWVLGITCGVTFLRLSGRLNCIFRFLENGIIEIEKEDK